MKYAKRIFNIEESKSVRLSALVAELRKKGEDIIGLHVGEPDFHTPQKIIDATKAALDKNQTRYSLVEGIEELRTSISQKYNEQYKLNTDQGNILLGNGSKHILYNIFQTLCDPLDEVIIPIPYWVSFPESVKLSGGVPVFVATKNNQLDVDAIENCITEKTKAIIINSPNNPSGAVFKKEDLKRISELSIKHGFMIISDEAYDTLLYDNIENYSTATLGNEAFKRTITVKSFSKSYCMTGFRIGYMIASREFILAVKKLQSHLSGNNCTFAQYGALEALSMDTSGIEQMVAVMEKRRDIAYDLAATFLDVERPQGAFYLFPNIEKYIGPHHFKNDIEMCETILKEEKVAVLPGSAFGDPRYMRICFASSEDKIVNGINKIKKVLCK